MLWLVKTRGMRLGNEMGLAGERGGVGWMMLLMLSLLLMLMLMLMLVVSEGVGYRISVICTIYSNHGGLTDFGSGDYTSILSSLNGFEILR